MLPIRQAVLRQDAILQELGREVVDARVAAGHRYKLEELVVRFDVSRTVIRDVIRTLESFGLVSPKRSIGVVVNPAGEWNVHAPSVIRWRLEGHDRDAQFRELTELRIAVEPLAASGAARQATPQARERLAVLARELRSLGEAGDLEAFLEADVEFHALILRNSGNSMFAALDGVVAEVLAGRTHAGLMPFHPRQEALLAHEGLAAAVVRGDSVAAEEQSRALLTEVNTALVQREQ